MDTNLKIAPKKDFNSIIVKMKRRGLRNKKLLSRAFANFSRKFWVTKLRKFKWDKDLVNHHALLLLANMDGQQIWNAL
jgi:hypothetical protein